MKRIISIFTFAVLAFVCVNCVNTCDTAVQASETMSVRASHILVDSKSQADELKARIDKGESFETLAKLYSKCPSGEQGGDLGYFSRGQMVKSFEDAAFSLPVGAVSEPVRTQFGWHLIKVYAKR